ncbi:Rhodanese-like domain [Nesidiocoris tenuis]|uniref:TBC1 domain family member 23 n=1 Tax=Nesidiocoris tenuis TaxID=355587 RepID=A0ABN7ATQ2_9HEMI|nr:Rhodanese-like domain [Nesidiocoris tenuis]
MAEEVNDKSWIAELESALKEEAGSLDGGDTDAFISEELRTEIWKSCLGVQTKSTYFDEIFDLPEQRTLRLDCQQVVDKLGNDEEDKLSVLSDLESLLTYHRKSVNVPYCSGNGWIDLLLPLIALKTPKSETYLLFEAIVTKFIPRGSSFYHLFRLLLLYHDPALCSFLDTKRITPEQYSATWFQSLFAASCTLPVTTKMWDLYFQQGDPFFMLFLGLVMVINSRDDILRLTDMPKESIVNALSALPSSLQESDVQDFCSLAQFYSGRTPGSFRQDLERCLFDDEDCPESTQSITQALCLPVNVSELVDNIFMPHELSGDGLRFFLVDCRPADQYNAGHMPTAFHLDCNLMLQAGDVYKMAVQGLLSAQKQALDANSTAGGEHLVFMGCGDLEQDQYTHMVVASFLRDSSHYVSILNGGYQSLHQYFGDTVGAALTDHNSEACLVCLSNGLADHSVNEINNVQSPSKDIFGKIGAVVKSKSVEVKEKLLEYIVNPGASDVERHVKPSDKKGKRYRNTAPVFSIDDEQDPQDVSWNPEEEDDSQFEIVSFSSWRSRNDIIASYECKELKINGDTYESELMISETHVYVLRHTNSRDKAKIVVRKPLLAIARITCKKKYPQIITFKYGSANGDNLVINDMDRFYIPKATEATKLISRQIVKGFQKKSDEENENEESPM